MSIERTRLGGSVGPTASSVEPPPMSTTRNGPVDGSRPAIAPANERRASSTPRQQLGLDADARRRRRRRTSSRFAASRAADVATTGSAVDAEARPGPCGSRAAPARVRSMASSVELAGARRRPAPRRVMLDPARERRGRRRRPAAAPSWCRCRWPLGAPSAARPAAPPPSARPGRRRRRGTRRSGRGGTSRRCAVPPTPPCGRGPSQSSGTVGVALGGVAAWAAASAAGIDRGLGARARRPPPRAGSPPSPRPRPTSQ